MSTKEKWHRGDGPYRGAFVPPFEIRNVAEPDGGLCLELLVEGERIATARSRGAALADMEGMLGLRRADVRVALEGMSFGMVWYDCATSATGSDRVPATVRAKMRAEVQRTLAQKRPSALRFVVEVLHGMSS